MADGRLSGSGVVDASAVGSGWVVRGGGRRADDGAGDSCSGKVG